MFPLFNLCGIRKNSEYQKDADGKEVRGSDGKRIVVKKGWGRRAPHIIYTTILLIVLGAFAYSPAKWADMLLNNAIVYGWKQEDGIWNDGPMPFTATDGLDCSKPLTLNTSIGMQYFNKTSTDSTNAVTLIYSSDICASLASKSSVCWPGPSGAKKTGDGAPRVCAKVAGETLAIHYLLIVTFTKFACEMQYAAMGPARIEVYPWKEERVQVNALYIIYVVLAILVFVVGNTQIQGQNELGTKPEGGQSVRTFWAIYLVISNFIGFGSIPAVRDAQQLSLVKTTNVLAEYKQILTSKHEAHATFRAYLLQRFLQTLWNNIRIGTYYYYCLYVLQVSLAQTALVIGLGAGVGLFLNAFLQGFWAGIFGMKSKNGREHGRDPRVWTLVVFAVGLSHDLDNHYWTRDMGIVKRREGVYKTLQVVFRTLAQIIGVIVVSSLVIGATPLCDTTIDPSLLNPACQTTIFHYWIILIPIIRVIEIWSVWRFPLTGDKIRQLYLIQGDNQKAVEGTDAANTVDFTKAGNVNPNPANKTPTLIAVTNPTVVETNATDKDV
eukprot:g12723.t1